MPKLALTICGLYMFSSSIIPAPAMSNNLNNVTSNEVTSISIMQPLTREAKEDSEIQPQLNFMFNNDYFNAAMEYKKIKDEVAEQERLEAERKDHKPHGQVVTDHSRFRTEPNYESEVITLLREGMTFDIIERQSNWLKIKFNDQEGFIDMSLVEQYEENPPHPEYVEPEPVYMDENTDGVPHYNPHNLRELSNLSVSQITKMLEGSALQTLARAYYYAEKEYNVNAIFLMSLNSEESGHGRSSLARSHNNIGGVKNGNGSWRHFSNWGECLNYIASLIDSCYLTPSGPYYNGPSIWNVNTKYCEGNKWAGNINAIANNLLSKL